jgi:hypothetical protein
MIEHKPFESVQLDRDHRVVFDYITNMPVDPNDLEAQKRYWPLSRPECDAFDGITMEEFLKMHRYRK